MKYIFFCAGFLMLAFSILSCQQKSQQKKELESALAKIDSSKGNFNPQFNMDTVGYYVLQSKYSNGSYLVDSAFVIKRNGKFPYRNEERPSLPFVVSYYDANNKTIGAYSIENPASSRSCEDGKQGIRFNEGALFDILLPANTAIKGFTISDHGKQLLSRDLPKRIITEKNDDNTGGTRDSIPGKN